MYIQLNTFKQHECACVISYYAFQTPPQRVVLSYISETLHTPIHKPNSISILTFRIHNGRTCMNKQKKRKNIGKTLCIWDCDDALYVRFHSFGLSRR